MPFDAKELYEILDILHQKLINPDVDSVSLYYLPYSIFVKTPLIYNPDSAILTYAIIESWVAEYEIAIHLEKKKRIFDHFLDECMVLVHSSSSTYVTAVNRWTEKGQFYEIHFNQEFVKTMITVCSQITNNPKIISDFIDGLAFLPEYWQKGKPEIFKKIDRLIQPAIQICVNNFSRWEKVDKYLLDDLKRHDEFSILGIKIHLSKSDFISHLNRIHITDYEHHDNEILKSWIEYKASFNKNLDNSNNEDTSSIEPIKDLEALAKLENKFWKGLPMDVVIKHFLPLAEKKNKVGESFLTYLQFVSFIKRGFLLNDDEPVQKINCLTGEKGFVIARFYEFYQLAAYQYGHVARSEKFVKLFIHCFDNWDEKSVKVYFKPNKSTESW
ncbi:hypothetical protein HXX01_01430 [Candidatus Nomurabacteria bacterium]|nr:hypothetical protein [Candidatus Nomurabacteria bacterium]